MKSHVKLFSSQVIVPYRNYEIKNGDTHVLGYREREGQWKVFPVPSFLPIFRENAPPKADILLLFSVEHSFLCLDSSQMTVWIARIVIQRAHPFEKTMTARQTEEGGTDREEKDQMKRKEETRLSRSPPGKNWTRTGFMILFGRCGLKWSIFRRKMGGKLKNVISAMVGSSTEENRRLYG